MWTIMKLYYYIQAQDHNIVSYYIQNYKLDY